MLHQCFGLTLFRSASNKYYMHVSRLHSGMGVLSRCIIIKVNYVHHDDVIHTTVPWNKIYYYTRVII